MHKYEDQYYVADSIESASTLCSKACKAGLKVFNLIEIEDLMIKDKGVEGLVLNWSSVGIAGLHVDPTHRKIPGSNRCHRTSL